MLVDEVAQRALAEIGPRHLEQPVLGGGGGGGGAGEERVDQCGSGGVEGGRAVAEACARQLKPANLELSGNNPVVVLPDADPATVVDEVVGGMLFLNGQYCVGPRRLVVPEDQAADYVRRFSTTLETVTIAATTDPASQLGPLSNRPHLERVEAQVAAFADRGCEVRRHGQLPDGRGHFMQPTVIEGVSHDAEISRAELFGPITCLYRVRHFEEAVQLANSSPYGLTASLHTRSLDRAMTWVQAVRCGVAVVNGPTHGSEPHMPFGGLRQSGNGTREAGTEALDVYSDWKTVYINYDPARV